MLPTQMSMSAHLLTETDTLYAHMFCSLHQLQMVEVAVTTSLRCNLTSRLYSLTLLLKSSGIFLRMANRLRSALRASLAFRHLHLCAPRPAIAEQYARKVCSYALSHYKQFVRQTRQAPHHWLFDREVDCGGEDLDAHADGDAQNLASLDQGSREFVLVWKVARLVFNGCWWEEGMFAPC